MVSKRRADRWYRRRVLWLWSVAIATLVVYVSLLLVLRIS